MPLAIAFELVMNGLLLGGVYALIACGLNLIFGVMRVINFAQGEFLALGALFTIALVQGAGLPYWVMILVIPLLIGALGLIAQSLLLRHVMKGPMIMSLLLTYAMSIIMVNFGIFVWGGGVRSLPNVISGSVDVMGVHLSAVRIVAFVIAMIGSAAIYGFLRFSMFGKCVRAVAQEPEIATISGIPLETVRNVTFAIGAAMAGLGGALIAPMFAVDPQMGIRFIIKAFAVIIIGGMGSYTGAFAAALMLGVVEVVGGFLFGQIFAMAVLYAVMIAFLLVRPKGLFGSGAAA